MNSFDPQSEDYSSSKRRYQQDRRTHINDVMASATPTSYSSSSSSSSPFYANPTNNTHYTHNFHSFPALDDHDLGAAVVPAVTVVLEGRSICHRISLHHHASYHSLARALRQMFVDVVSDGRMASESGGDDHDLDLSNAIPGHLIAYEDMENDLLLAGDLNWKDFVRVAKRIRIIPAKGNSRKGTTRGA